MNVTNSVALNVAVNVLEKPISQVAHALGVPSSVDVPALVKGAATVAMLYSMPTAAAAGLLAVGSTTGLLGSQLDVFA
ncbi:MAG: hypothetical protein EKK45_05235 [Curvibacter sp.]|nr:MAG: hypothetical protein EKK45_05235 [Curvibacter sp.]